MFYTRQQTTHVIVHCSQSPQGRGDNSEIIDRWHKERGFTAIGYHFVIIEDGTIEVGRPLSTIGAHCSAKGMNHKSVGICLIGYGPDFTTEQYLSLTLLLFLLEEAYPGIDVAGHRDFDDRKTCPGVDIKQWLIEMRKKVFVDRLNLRHQELPLDLDDIFNDLSRENPGAWTEETK